LETKKSQKKAGIFTFLILNLPLHHLLPFMIPFYFYNHRSIPLGIIAILLPVIPTAIISIPIISNAIPKKKDTNTPFRVTLDGHGLSWGQLQSTDTYRVLGLYFTSQNGFLQIYGTQSAVTKAIKFDKT
jgi:hypothetical protein